MELRVIKDMKDKLWVRNLLFLSFAVISKHFLAAIWLIVMCCSRSANAPIVTQLSLKKTFKADNFHNDFFGKGYTCDMGSNGMKLIYNHLYK